MNKNILNKIRNIQQSLAQLADSTRENASISKTHFDELKKEFEKYAYKLRELREDSERKIDPVYTEIGSSLAEIEKEFRQNQTRIQELENRVQELAAKIQSLSKK